MEELVKRLQATERIAQEQAQKVEHLEALLEQSDLMQTLQAAYARRDRIKGLQHEIRARIEDQAKAQYVESGDKHPHPRVEVRIYIDLQYKDQDAIAWCQKHDHPDLLTLKLRKRPFNKLARVLSDSGLGLDFVDRLEDPRVFVSL